MKKAEFLKLYQTVKVNLYWKGYNVPTELKGYIERKEKIKFLNPDELNNAINELKAFDINLLWDKSFWGLKVSDSICAVASEPYSYLKRLKENKIEI